MTNDDRAVGRVLSRREVVALLGAAGAAWLADPRAASGAAAGQRVPTCVVRPEQTEGPYFVDERLQRSDIRANPSDGRTPPGTPLSLTLAVSSLSAGACQPLADAIVDVWHCDALGVYSDVRDRAFNTIGQKFLRGYQLTDARGEVRFETIYPGWYSGRTVHIHFKIRTQPEARRGFEFTSQLYFDDALTDRVHTAAPYSSKGSRRTRNRDDGIFREGGRQLTLQPSEAGGSYAASFAVGLRLPGRNPTTF